MLHFSAIFGSYNQTDFLHFFLIQNEVCEIFGYLGHEQIADWLIQCGIDVNAKEKQGNTALHIAVQYSDALC